MVNLVFMDVFLESESVFGGRLEVWVRNSLI